MLTFVLFTSAHSGGEHHTQDCPNACVFPPDEIHYMNILVQIKILELYLHS